MKRTICLDWVQARVTLPYKNYSQNPTQLTLSTLFIVELREGITSQMFRSIYDIKDRQTGEVVAVLAADPRNELTLAEDQGIIKVVNKYLYQRNFKNFFSLLLRQLNLKFVNYVRIDVASDMLRFDTMECIDFINGFMNNEYLKNTSTKFVTHGTTKSVRKGKFTGGYELLKFGRETSDISYKLYNKTLEMEQKLHKQWIVDHWESNGYKGKDTVWRLEFSLLNDSKIVVSPGTGEVIIDFKDFDIIDNLENIFAYYFANYFTFVHTELTKKGNVKKQSRSKPLILIEDMKMQGVKIKMSTKKDAGRSSKIFAKNLMLLNRELRGQNFDMAIEGNKLFTWIIKTRGLDEWRKRKLPGTHLNDEMEEIIQQGINSNIQTELSKLQDLPVLFGKNGRSVA